MPSYTLREVDGKLHIDGHAYCPGSGCTASESPRCFEDIVIVHDPLSPNPGIQIPTPFGMAGLRSVLNLIEHWRIEQAEAGRVVGV
jgi:hypothetical protein